MKIHLYVAEKYRNLTCITSKIIFFCDKLSLKNETLMMYLNYIKKQLHMKCTQCMANIKYKLSNNYESFS